MRNALLVFLGGGLGSVLRYLTVLGITRYFPRSTFPWGVFTANILGSFILGFLCVLPMMKVKDQAPWLLASTGFLGGYTTFSTLANDSYVLLSGGHSWLALANALGSILIGVTAAALGWFCGRWACA